jgi:hypothetical protein
MGTLVTETPAASSDVALRHFEGMLAFETDCWDVHESLKTPKPDFILIDVRGPACCAFPTFPQDRRELRTAADTWVGRSDLSDLDHPATPASGQGA